jgi:hypothetical protein
LKWPVLSKTHSNGPVFSSPALSALASFGTAAPNSSNGINGKMKLMCGGQRSNALSCSLSIACHRPSHTTHHVHSTTHKTRTTRAPHAAPPPRASDGAERSACVRAAVANGLANGLNAVDHRERRHQRQRCLHVVTLRRGAPPTASAAATTTATAAATAASASSASTAHR